jgi:hypothetical protein
MPAKQLINLNGVGTFVNVTASIFARRVSVIEDASGAAAGIQVKFPDDNFTTVYKYTPAQQPVFMRSGPNLDGHGQGPLLGWPAQTGLPSGAKAASVYCQVASMGAATVIRVDEQE